MVTHTYKVLAVEALYNCAMAAVCKTLCLCLHILCWISPTVPDRITRPQLYTVDLDLPPEERWTHVIKDFKELLPDMNKVIGYSNQAYNYKYTCRTYKYYGKNLYTVSSH